MSAEWRFLITLNDQLRPLRDPVRIQEVALHLIGEHLHASRVNVTQVDDDELGSITCYSDACRRGETVVVSDVETDPRLTIAEREQLLAHETVAFVGAPLIKDGRWVATFGVRSAEPRSWTRDQIALVEVTAERTWGVGEGPALRRPKAVARAGRRSCAA